MSTNVVVLFFRIVYNSGPVISMLIILGCILNYVTVILYGFDYALVSPDTVTKLCRVSITHACCSQLIGIA